MTKIYWQKATQIVKFKRCVMHRCFIEGELNENTDVFVKDDEAIHIIKVLRYKQGDTFEICNMLH